MNVETLTDRVWERLQQTKPRALLIGEPPFNCHKFNYVNQKPYEAIVLGRLNPGQLLHMPDESVCAALLEGKPVYLWHRQAHHCGTTAKLLRRELYTAEQKLKSYGVQIMGGDAPLITAEQARKLMAAGKRPPAECRMTPLAREILEGKEL